MVDLNIDAINDVKNRIQEINERFGVGSAIYQKRMSQKVAFAKELQKITDRTHASREIEKNPPEKSIYEMNDVENNGEALLNELDNKKPKYKDDGGKLDAAVSQLQERLNASVGKTAYQKQAYVPTSDLADMIMSASRKYNVDPGLVSAIAEAESGGNQSAVSSAGAIGIMQLMPSTAQALGVNPYDARENVEGGTKYIRQMLDNFDGDVTKAVAAYNAGPAAVEKYGGVPPYPETQDYVNRVLDFYR